MYRDFEQYLAADVVDSRSWAVLDRFTMALDELVLGDGLLIREITDDERGFLTGRSREIMNPVSHREVHGDYVVEYEYQVPKDGGRSTTEVEETFDSVTLALKLFPQGGDVRYLSVVSDQFSPFEGARHRFSEGEAVTPSLRASCDLSEEECDEFLAFWDDHRGQLRDPPETMNIALRRYADAFQRREPEDRLIDLVISLEALLLKSGERQELSYRLSQRGALLLADDLEEAQEIRDQLKDAYNERSNVVHGVRDDVDRAYVGDVQELTRRCLLAMLEQAPRGRKEHASVLDVLDGEALDPR